MGYKINEYGEIVSPNGPNESTNKPVRGFNPWPMVIFAFVILGVVGFYFIYNNVIVPYQMDKNADHYYTFAANVYLRSSTISGIEQNKLATLPYGTELLVYDYSDDWSSVKVKGSSGKKGYIASQYIISEYDFLLLNGVFGDIESKNIISESRYRRAILNYYKQKGYVGHSDNNWHTNDEWVIYCYSEYSNTNNVYVGHIIPKSSKYPEFAVIIKNSSTQQRKLLIFSFDDNETPYLIHEESAPESGTIKKITYWMYNNYSYYNVDYSY